MKVSNDADLIRLKVRTKRSLRYVSIRSVLIYVLQSVSVLLLARWLVPADYGIYAILNSLVGVTAFFSDIGVGGALIQQSEAPTEAQLESCAAIQVGLGLAIAAGFFFAAPMIAASYHLTESAVWMTRLLGFTVPIYSLRGVPRLYWEREMSFEKIVRADVGETFGTYLVQIIAAAAGLGVWSFILANVARALIGTGIFAFTGAKFVKLRFDWKVLKPLLKFGLPFQAAALVPALKGLVVPLVLGRLLEPGRVGLVTWSVGIASIPIVLANNYNQVIFPSLSRLSHEQVSQRALANRSMQLAILGFAFIFALAATLSSSLVDWLFPTRWAEAKPLLPLAIASVGLSTVRVLSASTFNALNRPGARLWLETFGLIIEFSFTIFGLLYFQEIGYLAALVLVQTLMLVGAGLVLRDLIERGTVLRVGAGFIAGVASYCLVHVLAAVPFIPLQALAFTGCYFVIAIAIDGKTRVDLVWFFREIFSRLHRGA